MTKIDIEQLAAKARTFVTALEKVLTRTPTQDAALAFAQGFLSLYNEAKAAKPLPVKPVAQPVAVAPKGPMTASPVTPVAPVVTAP